MILRWERKKNHFKATSPIRSTTAYIFETVQNTGPIYSWILQTKVDGRMVQRVGPKPYKTFEAAENAIQDCLS